MNTFHCVVNFTVAMMECGSPQGVYLNTRSHTNLAATAQQQYQQRLSTSAMDSSMDTSRSYQYQQHQRRTASKSSTSITIPASFDESMLVQPTLYGLEASSVALSPLSPPNMQFDPAADHHRTMPGGIVYSRSYSSPQGESLYSHSVPQFYGTNAALFTSHENGLPPSKQFTFQLGDRNNNPYHHHHQSGTGTGSNSNPDSCTHSPMMQGVVVQNWAPCVVCVCNVCMRIYICFYYLFIFSCTL